MRPVTLLLVWIRFAFAAPLGRQSEDTEEVKMFPVCNSTVEIINDPVIAAGPHSMFQFYIGVSGVSNFPEVTVVTQVDDEPITYFDTNTMKAVPKTEWMRKSKDKDYWNRKTENTIVLYNQYKNNMLSIMNIFNHSKSDVHTLQLMFGCELENDGTSQGYMHIGYDGEDFMSLDMKTLKWIPVSRQAAIFKQTLEGNKDQEYLKNCVENKCIEALQKYVIYSKESLKKKDPPEVALLQKDSSSPVICHATGFYSKNTTMTWMKNHEELHANVEVSSTLPNTDGSFQKSISLSVNPEEWKKNPDVYKCVVQSVGKGKEIVVLLNENNIKSNSASDNIIVKCLVFTTIAIVVGCVVALAVFAAKKGLAWGKTTPVKSLIPAGYVKGSNTVNGIEMTDEPLQNTI